MAYGYIGQEKNFIYINGSPLLDVKSVDSSISTNRTPLNIGGVALGGLQVTEGVSEATMGLERHVISDTSNDPFADNSIFVNGFSGVWQHRDAAGNNNYFAMQTGYVNNYNFTAAVNSVPSTSMGLVSYGSGIGQIDMATGYMTGASEEDFLANYIFPKQIQFAFNDPNTLSGIVTTNRVQSFDISFTMNREVRNRLGQMKEIPETFIAYPIDATLSIDIDVDEYSIPAINTLLCQDPEDIFLYLKKCDGTVFRGFRFSSGVLQSASMNEAVTDMNRATLEYTRSLNSDADINFWMPF
tara:strand:- start:2582 stop:3475 length:894 start_codon:yes stop_codon:yes gene_type:complete